MNIYKRKYLILFFFKFENCFKYLVCTDEIRIQIKKVI